MTSDLLAPLPPSVWPPSVARGQPPPRWAHGWSLAQQPPPPVLFSLLCPPTSVSSQIQQDHDTKVSIMSPMALGQPPHLSEPPPLTLCASGVGGPAGQQRQVCAEAFPGEVAAGWAGISFDGAWTEPHKSQACVSRAQSARSVWRAGRRREGGKGSEINRGIAGGRCWGSHVGMGSVGVQTQQQWVSVTTSCGVEETELAHPLLAWILKVGRDSMTQESLWPPPWLPMLHQESCR